MLRDRKSRQQTIKLTCRGREYDECQMRSEERRVYRGHLLRVAQTHSEHIQKR